MIVIAFTTWRPRLCNIPKFLESLRNLTLPADKIVCTLSKQDFYDVPSCLLADDIEIQWIDKNIKVWKKLAVVLDLYPEAEIINVDDDVYYQPDFIEKLHAKFIETGQPVTPSCAHNGFASLVTAKMFNGIRPNDDVINNIVAADLWYSFIVETNGYHYVKCPECFDKREMIGSPEPYTTPGNINILWESQWIRNYYRFML